MLAQTLTDLQTSINSFKDSFRNKVRQFEDEVKESSRMLDEITLSEPYTVKTAPDRVKKMPKEYRDAWISTFNSALKQYKDEGKAFATANAQVKKMGLKEGSAEGALFEAYQFADMVKDNPGTQNLLEEVKKSIMEIKENTTDEELKKKADLVLSKINEAAPKGSLEEYRDIIVQAFNDSDLFVKDDNGYYSAWIQYIFMNKIIVREGDKFYEIQYAIIDGSVIWGNKKEVEQVFVTKEAESKNHLEEAAPWQYCTCPECGYSKTKEAGIACRTISCPECGAKLMGSNSKKEIKETKFKKTRDAKMQDKFEHPYISLKEAKVTEEKELTVIEAVLIEAGTNFNKKRHYPLATIKEAAPKFAGLKMYLNHPTALEEQTRPERDLKDWMSTIKESRYEDGKAIGVIKVHDKWLREMLQDPDVREHIGLSINTGGRISYGLVEGQEMQIVEEIVFARKNGPVSVDWVTEPGARGRVLGLMESRTKEKIMLENLTLTELKENRNDIVEIITKEAKAEALKESGSLQEKLKEAEAKIKEFEQKEKVSAQLSEVREALKESKLPEAAKERVLDKFGKEIVEDVKESVKKAIEAETDYINQISGASNKGKIKIAASDEGTNDIMESLSKGLCQRAGLKEEKKEEDE